MRPPGRRSRLGCLTLLAPWFSCSVITPLHVRPRSDDTRAEIWHGASSSRPASSANGVRPIALGRRT